MADKLPKGRSKTVRKMRTGRHFGRKADARGSACREMLPDRQLAAQPIERLRIVAYGTGDQIRWKQANGNVLRSVQHMAISQFDARAKNQRPRENSWMSASGTFEMCQRALRMSALGDVAPCQFKFLAISEIVSTRGQKSHRVIPPPRVVVSHGHIPAVKKHYVRAGGN
jgi:hypothetical protein